MFSFKENDGHPGGVVENEELYYTIGAVSEMYGIHPQTLRLYDREGLLKPARTKGNTRLYSHKDVQKLEMILRLTKELGVNRAGAQVVIRMREQLDEMRTAVNGLLMFIKDELGKEMKDMDEKFRKAVTKAPQRELFGLNPEMFGSGRIRGEK